jgi:protein LTV1
MGRRSKKKFDKKSSHVYHVVHRSQMDPSYGKEGASDMVLAPANDVAREALSRSVADAGEHLTASRGGSTPSTSILGDTVGPDGLRCDDGYDYSQHLKTMGGGAFIASNGKVCSSNAEVFNRVVLPDEVFGTEEEGRHRAAMEAVALDDRDLPSDVRAALRGAEDGARSDDDDFEELQDDFCAEAAKEPEGPSETIFDFDAHCAALIAKARARGQQHDHLRRGRRNPDEQIDLGAVGASDSESDWEFTTDEEEEEGGSSGSGGSSGADGSIVSVPSVPSVPRAPARFIDDHFDVVIGQYDDDELGDLDEDEACEGHMDIDSARVAELLDDFLEEHGEEVSRYHAKPVQDGVDIAGEAGVAAMRDLDEDAQRRVVSRSTRVVKEILSTSATQDGRAWDEEEVGMGDRDLDMNAMFPAKEVPQWDCETIVSTYSNLDNHPAVISAASTRPKIRLSRKTGLPLSLSQTTRPGTRPAGPGAGGLAIVSENVAGEATDSDAGEASDGEASDDEFGFETVVDTAAKRDRTETKEEKRARKKAVKLERARRRAAKKSRTGAFKEEGKRMRSQKVGRGKGMRLFKY